MKLTDITLCNFRRFKSARFFFDANFTVLIGINGKGKTSVLDAIAIMLGTYFQGSKIKTGQSGIKKYDARRIIREKGGQLYDEPEDEVYIKAEGKTDAELIIWRRDIGDRGKKARDFTELGERHRRTIKKGSDLALPIFLYYGTGRLWNAHRNIQTEKPGSQLDAYRFCLDPKSDQKAFEKWFKKLSFSKLQKNKEVSPPLDAVKKAVMSCIPNCQDFVHDTDLDEIVITLEEEGLIPFNLLSDGYRNIVAMVADIAHRAVRLNPHYGEDAAAKTKGVVLVDEIDLHLHPIWQRQIVGDLKKTFPGLQFIATTHSPFILQSLEPGEVIDLGKHAPVDQTAPDNQAYASPGPSDRYSNRSIEDITEEVMGVTVPQRSERYHAMYEAAKRYYTLLKEGEGATVNQKEEVKQQLDELSAPFSDNPAYHAFLKMERIAAGLGTSDDKKGNT